MLVMAGVPIRAVQELLGHSDIKMTMRYSHLASSNLHEAVNVMERLIVPYQRQRDDSERVFKPVPQTKEALTLGLLPEVKLAERMGFEPTRSLPGPQVSNMLP